MNSLSWLIWFADVSNKVGMTSGLLAALMLMVSALFISLVFFYYEGKRIEGHYVGEGSDRKYVSTSYQTLYPYKHLRKYVAIPIILFLLFLTLAVTTPSRDGIYLIAASQIGEQVIQLEQVQSLGGELGALASDTITILRDKISEQLPDVSKLTKATSVPSK